MKTLRSILFAGALAVSTLLPNLSKAQSPHNLEVNISQTKTGEFEDRFVSFTNGVINPTSPTTTLSYSWDFNEDSIEDSTISDPSYKWNVDANTTFEVRLDVTETYNAEIINDGYTTTSLEIWDTPLVTSRRFTEADFDRVINISPGEDTLKDVLVAEENTTDSLGLFLTNGVYSLSGEYFLTFRPNTTIVGNTIHRGDMLSDDYHIFDETGDSETSIFKVTVGVFGQNSGLYDLLLQRKGGAVGSDSPLHKTRIALNRNNLTLEGCLFDRCGDRPLEFDSSVTTGTLNSSRFYLPLNHDGVHIEYGPTKDDTKYGIVINNCRFDEVTPEGEVILMTANRLNDVNGSIAIDSDNPTTVIGGIYNVPIIERVLATSGGEFPFIIRYADAYLRDNPELMADGLIVDSGLTKTGSNKDYVERNATISNVGGYTFIKKDGETFDVTGWDFSTDDSTTTPSAVLDWTMYSDK